MARLLIVEDETALGEILCRGPREESYSVDLLHDGDEGYRAALGCDYDLIILDVMLPGLSGVQVCRQLRAAGVATPILMLTARDQSADVVKGLDSGANDYVKKPFVFEELLARVRVLLRLRLPAATSVLMCGDMRLDLESRRVHRGTGEILLTAKEFQILECLALRQGAIVSKEVLAQAAWARDELPYSNVLEVYISNLRRKLDHGGLPRLIRTQRGRGYLLQEPDL